MSIIGSLFLGCEGNYNVFNTPISFEVSGHYMTSENSHFFVSLTKETLHSYPFRITTLAFTHFFVHEMGHALANQMLFPMEKYHSSIVIFTDQFGAYTTRLKSNEGYKSSLVSLAGPLIDMIYSCTLLAAAVLIGKKVSKFAGYMLGTGSLVWILGELVYAFSSPIRNDIGDFAAIADNGIDHLLVSLSLLVSTCALGIFGSIKLACSK